jgi:bifunctional DNA primase/polymerase-like protein/AAA domain-containing protein
MSGPTPIDRSETATAVPQYVARGWPVFPLHEPKPDGTCTCHKGATCDSPGKHPRTQNGLKDATVDPDKVKKWWQKWPDSNIGLRTDGYAVFDFDVKTGGLETLAQWESEHPELLAVPRILTGEFEGRRGQHLYFRQSGSPLRNRTGFVPGVDLRADGGFVVAPPSLHRSGVRYEGTVGDVPVIFSWLEQLARSTVTAATDEDAEGGFAAALSRVTTMREGDGRNSTMAQLLGPLAGRLPRAQLVPLIRFLNGQFAEPLNDAELLRVLESIVGREAQRRSTELQQAIDRLRINSDAKRIFNSEEADKEFVAPVYRRSLAEDLRAQPETPPETLVGLHRTGANAMLASQFKAGKTTLMANLVRSLADGTPFLDHYEVNFKGRVALFNFELDESQMIEWLGNLQVSKTERITTVNLRGQRLPLISERAQQWLVEFMNANDITAWVLDPFARAFAGCGNENDNSDVGVFLEALDEIKRLSGVRDLWLVHHFGRKDHEQGQEHGRGATRLDDWADVRWLLTRQNDDRFLRVEGRGVFVEETQLVKGPSGRLSLGTGTRQDSKQNEKARKLEQVTRRILDVVKARPGISSRDIASALAGTDKSIVSQRLRAAIDAEEIEVRRGPRNSKLHYPIESDVELF